MRPRLTPVAFTLPPLLVATHAAALCGDPGFATPVATGFDVAPYADVADPLVLSFDADGNLFTGRDAQGSGAGAADPVAKKAFEPGACPLP